MIRAAGQLCGLSLGRFRLGLWRVRRARIAPDHPPVDQTAAYVEKYTWGFERLGVSASEYAAQYSTPIVISLDRLRTYY